MQKETPDPPQKRSVNGRNSSAEEIPLLAAVMSYGGIRVMEVG